MSTQTKPSHPPPKNDFSRWEGKFDDALERPDRLKAWRTLVDHQCDPLALKSALYYASEHLYAAHELPEKWRAYSSAWEDAVDPLIELEKTLHRLMEVRALGIQIADDLLLFYGVKKREITFFKTLPATLGRIERILTIIKVPSTIIRNRLKDMLTASGEALLYTYVKETTKKVFKEEVSILLEASAAAYGHRHVPGYDGDTAYRRYVRFRGREPYQFKTMQHLVREFISNGGGTGLAEFAKVRAIELGYDTFTDYMDRYE